MRSGGQGRGEAVFYQADLSSLAGARQLAEAVTRRAQAARRLHQQCRDRIAHAWGLSGGPARTDTNCGLRSITSPGFLLAYLLLPLLKASAPSRIVNVASLGQHPIDFDDVMITKGYSGSRAYAQSKLAQIMFTIDLASELKGSGRDREFAAPGDLHEHHDGARRRHHADLARSSRAAKRSCIWLSATTWPARAGCSSTACSRRKANPQAYDAAARQRLRALSSNCRPAA